MGDSDKTQIDQAIDKASYAPGNASRPTAKLIKGKASTSTRKPPKAKGDGKPRKPKRTFPAVTLEEALKVPQAIRQKNNGHPWNTALVATACGTTRKTVKFFYLAAAARDYGLTDGSRDTPEIALV